MLLLKALLIRINERLNNYNCEEVYTPQIEESFEKVYNPTQIEVPLNEEVKTLKMIKTNKKK